MADIVSEAGFTSEGEPEPICIPAVSADVRKEFLRVLEILGVDPFVYDAFRMLLPRSNSNRITAETGGGIFSCLPNKNQPDIGVPDILQYISRCCTEQNCMLPFAGGSYLRMFFGYVPEEMPEDEEAWHPDKGPGIDTKKLPLYYCRIYHYDAFKDELLGVVYLQKADGGWRKAWELVDVYQEDKFLRVCDCAHFVTELDCLFARSEITVHQVASPGLWIN